MIPSNALAKLDVVVIGSGMVGIATALELQTRGKTVAVVDPGDPLGRASYGNSGVISRAIFLPMSGPEVWRNLPSYALNRSNGLHLRYRDINEIAPWGVDFLKFCTMSSLRAGVKALDSLLVQAKSVHLELAQELGTLSWLRDTGWLRVYKDQSSVGAIERDCGFFREYGVPHEVLNQAQIQDLEPQLKQNFEHAIFLTDATVLPQPGRLVERAREAFIERGGHVLQGSATQLYQESDNVVVVVNNNKQIARQAVVAAGVRSRTLARQLGYRVPMIAGRGYHVHFPLVGGDSFKRSITNVSGGYGIGPEPGGVRLVTGIELGNPDGVPNYQQITRVINDFSALMNLSKVPEQVMPAAGNVWLGSRPMTSDGLPVLGQAPKHNRIFFAFGHSHIGLATGPITGKLIAQLASGESPSVSLSPFGIQRFRGN